MSNRAAMLCSRLKNVLSRVGSDNDEQKRPGKRCDPVGPMTFVINSVFRTELHEQGLWLTYKCTKLVQASY